MFCDVKPDGVPENRTASPKTGRFTMTKRTVRSLWRTPAGESPGRRCTPPAAGRPSPRIPPLRTIIPGQEVRLAKKLNALEKQYTKFSDRKPIVLQDDHVQGALGQFDPKTGQVYIFSGERYGSAARAEEMLHYFQYRKRGLIGKSESEIGDKVIFEVEKEVEEMLAKMGYRPRR